VLLDLVETGKNTRDGRNMTQEPGAQENCDKGVQVAMLSKPGKDFVHCANITLCKCCNLRRPVVQGIMPEDEELAGGVGQQRGHGWGTGNNTAHSTGQLPDSQKPSKVQHRGSGPGLYQSNFSFSSS
jgi:hypothetical protein